MGGREKFETNRNKNPLLHTRIFSKSDPINRAPAIVLTFNIYSHFVPRSRYMYTCIHTRTRLFLFVCTSNPPDRFHVLSATTTQPRNFPTRQFVEHACNRLGDVRFDGQSIKRVSRGFARILRPVPPCFDTCSLYGNIFATTKAILNDYFAIVSQPQANRIRVIVIVLISADDPSVWSASGLIFTYQNRGKFISRFYPRIKPRRNRLFVADRHLNSIFDD